MVDGIVLDVDKIYSVDGSDAAPYVMPEVVKEILTIDGSAMGDTYVFETEEQLIDWINESNEVLKNDYIVVCSQLLPQAIINLIHAMHDCCVADYRDGVLVMDFQKGRRIIRRPRCESITAVLGGLIPSGSDKMDASMMDKICYCAGIKMVDEDAIDAKPNLVVYAYGVDVERLHSELGYGDDIGKATWIASDGYIVGVTINDVCVQPYLRDGKHNGYGDKLNYKPESESKRVYPSLLYGKKLMYRDDEFDYDGMGVTAKYVQDMLAEVDILKVDSTNVKLVDDSVDILTLVKLGEDEQIEDKPFSLSLTMTKGGSRTPCGCDIHYEWISGISLCGDDKGSAMVWPFPKALATYSDDRVRYEEASLHVFKKI